MALESASLHAAHDERSTDDPQLDLGVAIESEGLEHGAVDNDRRAVPDAREPLPPSDALCRPTVPGVLCTRLQFQAIERIRQTGRTSESWRCTWTAQIPKL
jgi:hypothetical protein